jgi:hypothetical protein
MSRLGGDGDSNGEGDGDSGGGSGVVVNATPTATATAMAMAVAMAMAMALAAAVAVMMTVATKKATRQGQPWRGRRFVDKADERGDAHHRGVTSCFKIFLIIMSQFMHHLV